MRRRSSRPVRALDDEREDDDPAGRRGAHQLVLPGRLVVGEDASDRLVAAPVAAERLQGAGDRLLLGRAPRARERAPGRGRRRRCRCRAPEAAGRARARVRGRGRRCPPPRLSPLRRRRRRRRPAGPADGPHRACPAPGGRGSRRRRRDIPSALASPLHRHVHSAAGHSRTGACCRFPGCSVAFA